MAELGIDFILEKQVKDSIIILKNFTIFIVGVYYGYKENPCG